MIEELLSFSFVCGREGRIPTETSRFKVDADIPNGTITVLFDET